MKTLGLVMALASGCTALASGCAHMITVESTPPGASVLVNGEVVGRTPCVIEEKTGRDDLVAVEVSSADRAAHFAYQKTGVATDAVAGAASASCGMCALGGGGVVSLLLVVPVVLFAGAASALAIGVIVGAYAAYAAGALLIAYAPYLFVVGVGEGARKGPDRIHVDFGQSTPVVTTTPEGMTVPFVGRSRSAARAAQRY